MRERLLDAGLIVVVVDGDAHLPLGRGQLARHNEVRDCQSDGEDQEQPDHRTFVWHLAVRLGQHGRQKHSHHEGSDSNCDELTDRLTEAIADDAAEDPDSDERDGDPSNDLLVMTRQLDHLPAVRLVIPAQRQDFWKIPETYP